MNREQGGITRFEFRNWWTGPSRDNARPLISFEIHQGWALKGPGDLGTNGVRGLAAAGSMYQGGTCLLIDGIGSVAANRGVRRASTISGLGSDSHGVSKRSCPVVRITWFPGPGAINIHAHQAKELSLAWKRSLHYQCSLFFYRPRTMFPVFPQAPDGVTL